MVDLTTCCEPKEPLYDWNYEEGKEDCTDAVTKKECAKEKKDEKCTKKAIGQRVLDFWKTYKVKFPGVTKIFAELKPKIKAGISVEVLTKKIERWIQEKKVIGDKFWKQLTKGSVNLNIKWKCKMILGKVTKVESLELNHLAMKKTEREVGLRKQAKMGTLIRQLVIITERGGVKVHMMMKYSLSSY